MAFSGGGDSLALLLVAADWAAKAGRELVVFTVDHGLRAESVAWTRTCTGVAQRLSLPFQALDWVGEKPATGLPAAARAARHRLLAEAARAAGARVILLGHTADDVLEARQMRAAGSTTPEPRGWSPSPAWPAGRGLFLQRPLLDVRRAAIRDWLRERGEAWIDDPANDDLAYARPRARQVLAGGGTLEVAADDTAAALAQACIPDADGGVHLPRAAFRQADDAARRRVLSAACVCAGGTPRPPRAARVQALSTRLVSGAPVTATLAGARITADDISIHIGREPGEAARGGLAPLSLLAGQTGVWDGRFEVRAETAVTIQAGRRGRPDIVGGAAILTALTHARLLAACGTILREPA